MTTKILVGLDGTDAGQRAVSYACKLASLIDDAELILVFVIEWSPYSFQTAEENERRHKRREEEIATATSRIVQPALDKLRADGVMARGVVKHGDVAELLNAAAVSEGAVQIVVARASEQGVMNRIFGSATMNLVAGASVPVTIVA